MRADKAMVWARKFAINSDRLERRFNDCGSIPKSIFVPEPYNTDDSKAGIEDILDGINRWIVTYNANCGERYVQNEGKRMQAWLNKLLLKMES